MRHLLLGIFIVLPALCQDQQTCLWMNSATAGGLLSGAVTSRVIHSSKNKDDATCTFSRGTYELQIIVETMAARSRQFAKFTSTCGSSAAPLKTIGNEAVACSLNPGNGGVGEQVIGRVRDRAFIIRISTNNQSIAPASLLEKASIAAEQVAGNLF